MGLEGIVASYLAERRAVGVRPERYEGRPSGILEPHGRMGCPEDALPRELVEAWCEPRPGESEANRLERTCRARGLAEYMVRSGFDAYVCIANSKLRVGPGTGSPYQTMMFGGWRVLP